MMGRFSQLAVASARLGFEDAGLSITPSLASEISICYGSSGGGDIFETATRSLLNDGVMGIKHWAALEYPPHSPSSYISIELGIKGPALSLASNCCTGLDSINVAYSRIVSQKAKVVAAGSCEAPVSPTGFGTFCSLGALTTRRCPPEEASRPYDLLRDGLVIAEGAGTLILEDAEFALSRGAHIYAEVLGYGGASEAVGMRKGDPSGKVMAQALTEAIRVAGLAPTDIDYVNAHGSSLPDFDIAYTNAFKAALGPRAYSIQISSIKSMIGQPFAAAGTIQTAAACLTLEHQRVPPTVNQRVPDPNCDLDYVPNISRPARVRRVLINGHSFGGSVAALVIGRFDEKHEWV
jgi:3-oxoacyl-[acyl-carrier-protein] synthase II